MTIIQEIESKINSIKEKSCNNKENQYDKIMIGYNVIKILKWVLGLLKKRCCTNCKYISIWIEKQGELKDNIYSCNHMECQNIKKDYCSYFEIKE
jgi:hypothetical protein